MNILNHKTIIVFITLEKINKERISKGEKPLQNPRNAAAGSIRQLDSKVAAKRNLDAFLYHLPNPEYFGIKTHHEALEFMKNLGFKTNPNNRIVKNIDEVMAYIHEKGEIRKDLPYDIDGVVITHGTDTLEETAYFLDLTIESKIPIVVTGAMRSSNEIGADGLYNLISSIKVAASEEAKEKGVLVVLNDEIHTAENVTKTHTSNIEILLR